MKEMLTCVGVGLGRWTWEQCKKAESHVCSPIPACTLELTLKNFQGRQRLGGWGAF